jgi:simple sugar transport system ATP-binding protein
VRENIALALQARMGLAKVPQARRAARDWRRRLVAALGIKTASIETPIGSSRAATSRRPSSRAGSPRIRAC